MAKHPDSVLLAAALNVSRALALVEPYIDTLKLLHPRLGYAAAGIRRDLDELIEELLPKVEWREREK